MPSCLLHFQTTITLLFIVPNCIYLYVRGISIITALHITCSRYTNNHSFHLGEITKWNYPPSEKVTFYSFTLIFFWNQWHYDYDSHSWNTKTLQSATTNYHHCFSIYLFEPLSDGLKIHVHIIAESLCQEHTPSPWTRKGKRTACTCIMFSFTYVVCLLIPSRKRSVPLSQGVRSQFCWASS